ncbi:hypothetical protein M3Y95_00238400 [Aphelenchoides besseyi]|nr:hypothetical protein M3Y95_00238400 [Aphelenchoides besseyi]
MFPKKLIYQQCHVKWNFFSVGNAKIHRGRLAVFQNNHNTRSPKVEPRKFMGNWKTKLLKNVSLEKNSLYEKDSLFPVFRMSCWVVCDEFGDLVREGLYVTAKGALRFCYVYQNKRRARIERQGCFNGTRDDDPNDKRFHFSKGQIWHTKEYDFRCGDDGFQVYKCKPSAKELVHTGVAWFNC